MAQQKIRWGILGTGGIAGKYARDLAHVHDAIPLAVGSRAEPAAQRFADQLDVPRAYGSYAELVADPDVDVVYVATPHSLHADNMKLAINAGKAVLCEKPFTITADEARDAVALARSRGVLLMEAMWTRFLPHMRQIGALLADGAIGEVTTIVADHGQDIPDDGHSRLHRPELGGGALLDLGIYPVSFAMSVLGRPDRVTAVGAMLPHDVDSQTSMVFEYESGGHAVLTTTLRARTANRAVVSGTAGRIEIGPWWFAPTSYTLYRDGSDAPEVFESPKIGTGLWYQAAAVGELLRAGALESPLMPLDESVAILEVMDEVRGQIGLQFR